MAMQSRRDLLQAHRLMTRRAALALLRGEPDVPDQPMRRINVATFTGILAGAIAIGIFVIIGLLFHGSAALKYAPGTLIMDKDTGTAWVFCDNGKKICQTVNYASALLALQTPTPVVQSVSQSELSSFPHGSIIGIPNLPDLPKADLLVTQPWSVCTQTLSAVPGSSGPQTTTILSGGIQTGGRQLTSTSLLLVTSQADSSDWVIWQGQRMAIDPTVLRTLFSQDQADIAPVPPVWLNAIPQAQPFQPPQIANLGQTETGPDGNPAKIGQTYEVDLAGSTNYYVLQSGGQLSQISRVQDELLDLNGQNIQISEGQLNGHVSGNLPSGGLPRTLPAVAEGKPAYCVVYSAAAAGGASAPALTRSIVVGGKMPKQGLTATGGSAAAPASGQYVDDVAMPPGAGALVRETGNSVGYFLITGGMRYSLASTAVPSYLGYDPKQAVALPSGLVDLIPSGPGLSPAQAKQTVPTGSGFAAQSGS